MSWQSQPLLQEGVHSTFSRIKNDVCPSADTLAVARSRFRWTPSKSSSRQACLYNHTHEGAAKCQKTWFCFMRRRALESSPICIGLHKNSVLCFIFHIPCSLGEEKKIKINNCCCLVVHFNANFERVALLSRLSRAQCHVTSWWCYNRAKSRSYE